MKKLILALVLSLTVLLPRAQAVDTQLGTIRAEVANQLTIASNNVAATNEVVLNKKLVKTLQGALKSIDKTKTNYAAGAKTLSVLNKSLGRTVLSNEFNPLIEGTVDAYVVALASIFDVLEERVDSTYPGKSQEAARKALAKFFAGIDGAYTNANIVLALKSLAAATKAEAGARKAVIKAENAPAPPSSFKATITGALFGTFNFTPKPAEAVAAVYSSALNNLIINGVNGSTSGSGLNTKVTTRQLLVTIPNLTDGTTTYQIGDDGGEAFVMYNVVRGGLGGSDGQDGYQATSGSLTVTVNKAAKTAYGTFSFTAPGAGTATTASTSNGSFSFVWEE